MSNTWSKALIISLIFIAMLILPVSATPVKVGNVINQSATVFIGEDSLDITNAMGGYTKIGWWASGASINETSPRTIDVNSRLTSMSVSQSEFVGYTGTWYRTDGNKAYGSAFYVEDPYLTIDIWNTEANDAVSGESVVQGTNLTFKVDTNIVIGNNRYTKTSGASGGTVYSPVSAFTATRGAFATQVGFTDTSSHAPTRWLWNFGDGSTSDEQNPIKGYANTNNYTVTLTTANAANIPEDPGTNESSIYTAYVVVTSTSVTVIPVGSGTTPKPEYRVVGAIASGYRSVSPTDDGYVTIKVKSESGATYSALYDQQGVANTVNNLYINEQPYVWNHKWSTGYTSGSQYMYPPGTYEVYAESNLNGMKDNYRSGGADYTGKTVSYVRTVILTSDVVKLEVNKDNVVRGKSFSVTLTGKPSAPYHMWLKGIGTMNGTDTNTDSIPPQIMVSQEGVNIGNSYTGSFKYENGGGNTIAQSVPDVAGSNPYYATVTTSSSGTRTIEFVTSSATKAQRYTVRVESDHAYGANAQSDEIEINVDKGTVTIVASGDQNYFLGEEIKFSGTNSESYTTYLSLIGPNLPEIGAKLSSDDPRHFPVVNNQSGSFTTAPVNGDGSWSYKWGTATVALDAGTYTVYAVNIPRDTDHLDEATYGTTSIVMKKPFVSASASSSVVAQGDKLSIIGTAEGDPSSIQIWVLGKNKYITTTQSVNSDASFTYEITSATTNDLSTGQYFVVVQHPMQNGKFDIVSTTDSNYNTYVRNLQLNSGMNIFKLGGSGSLQGSDAAQALIEAINDPNVDDTYTKFQFLVENPYIYITPITDKRIGDKFTISAETNLAVDDEVLVEVYSSSFKPTQKSQSGEFSGTTGTVKVVKGEAGLNKLTIDIDSANFKADEYIVKEDAIIQDATGTAIFNVLDASAVIATPTAAVVTVAPTPVVLTAAPTPAQTLPVVTAEPTVNASATTAKPTPGYGALIALIGLSAVAFIVVRREQ